MRITLITTGFVVLAVVGTSVLSSSQSPPENTPPSSAATPQRSRAASPEAFLTSKRVVYELGDPIDLTFAVSAAGSPVMPRFSIVNAAGETMPAVQQSGKFFWESGGKALDGKERSGVIAANQSHTEAIADLGQWYGLALPGLYEVTFDGTWTDEQKKPQLIPSNTILIKIVDPADPAEEGVIEGRTIPLSDIWALDMPGTKPMNDSMRGANPSIFMAPEGQLVNDIRRLHMKGSQLVQPARPGFAVRGSGLDALRQARDILVDEQQPESTFRLGEQLSLIFFSKTFGAYVHLDNVTCHGNIVQISYSLVPHKTRETTSHFALIPLPPGHRGTIQVEMKPNLTGNLSQTVEFSRNIERTVVHSFQFDIEE